jgi:hypothetical protein
MRDVADIEDLIVLSGLETLNSYLLNQNKDKDQRIAQLTQEAKKNFQIIQNQRATKELKNLTTQKND